MYDRKILLNACCCFSVMLPLFAVTALQNSSGIHQTSSSLPSPLSNFWVSWIRLCVSILLSCEKQEAVKLKSKQAVRHAIFTTQVAFGEVRWFMASSFFGNWQSKPHHFSRAFLSISWRSQFNSLGNHEA